ncbi:MAG TPA: protein kinase [Polyangiaceae bacterium]|nr:protein kinase [Polyangiaceae bacterium]
MQALDGHAEGTTLGRCEMAEASQAKNPEEEPAEASEERQSAAPVQPATAARAERAAAPAAAPPAAVTAPPPIPAAAPAAQAVPPNKLPPVHKPPTANRAVKPRVATPAEEARRTDPNAVNDVEILSAVPEKDEDSAPPSIPSAAEVKSAKASPAGAPVLPGQVIASRYEVMSLLGEGGMGIVYRCRDQSNGHQVALKRVIPPPGNLANEYLMWFYKEARALAALDHPNIVKARDFGQLRDGSPYLVMELVQGISMHDLAHTRVQFPVLWAITDRILSALAHAHARGIIHGDLKPSNILVERRDDEPPDVHVLDFGLAWLRQDWHDERLDGSKAMEFAPHAGAGTPGYMAPEQIQHEMHYVCGATDLYALGCILYRIIAGRAPFSGESRELLRVHAFEPPPKFTPVFEVPAGVEAFVMRLLAKRPWDRWEFAAECRRDWARFRPEERRGVWFFPTPPRAQSEHPKTRPTGPRAQNPDLLPAPERAPGLLSIRPSPLVGRRDVRERLRAVCDEVIQGGGAPHRLVLLVGPAGCGKSRIAEWLCETVHEEGTMVPLRSRYRKIRSSLDGMLGAAVNYYNFERVDRNTIERSLLDRWKVRRDDKNGRAWVAGTAEWFRPMGPMSDQPIGPSGIRFTLDTLETRRMVIRYTLRRIANGRPLLFWLDDLHNAAPTTFEGLLRTLTDDPDQRIVMVGTVRSEDVALGTQTAERLRELRDAMQGVVIQIDPLPNETTLELLRASLPLDDAAAQEAARRSRGNPLFALQQLHAWALAGSLELKDNFYRVPPDVLAVRPETTAELWDTRLTAVPEAHRPSAHAAATLGGDIRRNVLFALLTALGQPADAAILSLQNAEILIPRGPGRLSWPHELLQEHLLLRLGERPDKERIYRAAAAALTQHPLANTRRIVRQRVVNLMQAGDADSAAYLLFDFLQNSWNGAREPLATLDDLELFKNRLSGRTLALKNRWQAECLRHVGRTAEASTYAELARTRFEELGDQENIAHCVRLLGHIASEQGSNAEGLELVQRALRTFEALGSVLGQAHCQAVAGEIQYLLGSYEEARATIEQGERNFAALDQPLGRGQCLLLLSWIDHSEGATERSRRLAQEARAEFERAGYRLGTAQADASLSHVEHRLMNFTGAERGALEALTVFETLRTPRGQAACDRLLAMIAVDTDDVELAERHAERSHRVFTRASDPWGIVEAMLLLCQAARMRHDLRRAVRLLEDSQRVPIEEAEPRQHLLLTRAWLECERGELDRALESIESAAEVFGPRTRAGDHTPHLLGRLSRYRFSAQARDRIEAWRALLNDRARRRE